ncbi:DUF1802 family protein [Oscillatoria sp. FACHB-1407]|uniref:DUF1802 family protein n=1 Tax=Oscillatoria sp. FACHB-1407 TaxID=2692847 RepID=UPI0016876395|nr:DUF1802 family protein [Oscillatoria sp. FACHB-1407]MBD2460602.1 DUF1802 family protein [Oscillatoria sp. FACHB-1407]
MNAALKEWAIAVEALTQGKTILLLRKGGIREERGRFTVAHHQVWLYPTYEHQQPNLLKSPYDQQVQPVPSGWHPEQVVLTSWAEITHVLPIQQEAAVQALLPFHIWNEAWVSDRLRWKPQQPLYGLLLRVHALETPLTVPYHSDYGGCKSWIELPTSFTNAKAQAVLTDASYQDVVSQIQQIVGIGEKE